MKSKKINFRSKNSFYFRSIKLYRPNIKTVFKPKKNLDFLDLKTSLNPLKSYG